MLKKELVDIIAGKTGLKKKDTEATIDAFMEAVKEAMKNGKKVKLVNFGVFDLREQKAREGRDPRSKEVEIKVQVPATKTPIFTFAKSVKDYIKAIYKED